MEVSASHAVVAVPPALAVEIVFDPVLPNDRMTLYRKAVAGSETKTLLVYDEPFWRTDGLSGQTAGPGSVAEVTLDATAASGSPGVIASFTFGRVAERVDALGPHRTAACGSRRVSQTDSVRPRRHPASSSRQHGGPRNGRAGCSMAHFPPGILTRYGPLLRQPFERVHWAGTETSTTSHGAIDGAVRSGERASREILDRQ